jgi:hypothetical protein
MLAPRAWNLIPFPALSSSQLKASNTFEWAQSFCGRSSGEISVTEFPNPLYRSLVGLKGIAVTGNRTGDILQKIQGRLEILMPMKGHKTSRK